MVRPRCCKKSLDIINGAIRWLLGTLGSVASLLAATLYQGNHDRNFGSTERCTLYAGAAAVMICEAPYDNNQACRVFRKSFSLM